MKNYLIIYFLPVIIIGICSQVFISNWDSLPEKIFLHKIDFIIKTDSQSSSYANVKEVQNIINITFTKNNIGRYSYKSFSALPLKFHLSPLACLVIKLNFYQIYFLSHHRLRL